MRKAFTLIELLVVIAIIAILAAILFPVFAQAKFAAKKTASLSGLKQMALGLQMYSNDSDDMAVFEYGYSDGSIPGDTNAYHYNTTWAGRILPYVKNQPIFFDKTIPEITNYNQYYQDPYYSSSSYSYSWAWITNFSLNTDGYSRQTYAGSSCVNYGSSTSAVRSLTAIDQPASRLAITPTRYGTIGNWSWARFIAYDASFPYVDIYANGFSWNQLVYDARKQYGTRFIGGYSDGHAGMYGPEKFVKRYYNNPSQNQANGWNSYCGVMDSQKLWDFWGPFWSGN
ncbi:MAG: prepilin-type N-terminal cleavage/methylation domain-containing protein [Fimbriimonas sp.]|nr:prepilin-type N-terminal cleavage/methylation domain-containing protein [Fimbriimonas sp.]